MLGGSSASETTCECSELCLNVVADAFRRNNKDARGVAGKSADQTMARFALRAQGVQPSLELHRHDVAAYAVSETPRAGSGSLLLLKLRATRPAPGRLRPGRAESAVTLVGFVASGSV